MKNIVVIIERFQENELVCQYGLKLAQQLKSSLILLNVNREPNGVAIQFLLEIRNNLWKSEERQSGSRTAITCIVENGTFFSTLEGLEKKINIDLIVMGVNSENINEDLLVEYKIKEVADRTNSPILLIPEDSHLHGLKCIYYITDILYDDYPVVTKLSAIAKPLNLQISLVHVRSDSDRLLNLHREVTKVPLVDSFSENTSLFSSIYKNNRDKHVEDTISQIESNGQGIIAMANHRYDERSFIENCSKNGNVYRNIPLLLMPVQ